MPGKHSKDYGDDYKIRQPKTSNTKNNSKSPTNKKKSSSQINKKIKRKRTNRLDAILKVLTFIYIVISIMFYISVIKMDLLPGAYVTIFTIAEIVFTVFLSIGIIKNHKTLKMNFICVLIAIIVSIVYINAINYVNATMNFFGSVFKEVEETEEYYVVVKKGSAYNSIDDIKEENVYLYNAEDDVKEDVSKKINKELKTKDSLDNLGKELIDGKIKAILLSSSQYNMLGDEIEKFKDSTKIIYTTKHTIKVQEKAESVNSKYKVSDKVFNIYISGIDTSGNISNVARSDANILATVNTKTHEVLLTSIPRDYYVTLHSKKAKDKLTHSGIYGINETVTTVEDLLDIDINYYVRVNFTTVIKLVDTLGGIDVYSDYSFSTANGYQYKKGYNHVNGDQALVFSRERYSFAAGDNQRVKNQQHVIEAIIKKVANSTTILTKYTDILNSMKGCFQTNISQDEISSLVKGQLENMSSWTVKSNALTGTGSYGSTYSMGSQQLYIMLPDSTSIQNAKQQIKSVMDK